MIVCFPVYNQYLLISALAGVAQWIEHQPANQRVAGSIPHQGIYLGCRPGPQWGACKRQPYIDVSLCSPLSKNK